MEDNLLEHLWETVSGPKTAKVVYTNAYGVRKTEILNDTHVTNIDLSNMDQGRYRFTFRARKRNPGRRKNRNV